MIGSLGRFVSLDGLTEKQVTALYEATRGGIVTISGQKVIVKLPKDMQRHTAIRRQDVMICFPPHCVEIVHCQISAQQLMSQTIHF